MKGNTVNTDSTMLKNRLQKNQKKLKSYLEKGQLEAWRLYNKDIPEYPYIIDIYGPSLGNRHAVVFEQGKKLGEEDQQIRLKHQAEIETVLTELLGISAAKQHFKIRERQKGNEQYRPLEPRSQDYFTISEPPFKFWVNLERYLDTGLFLDHRPLRQHIFNTSRDKKVLNLFCYTGSISVAAALGGGKVTSVDMSATYLDWAYDNFLLNEIDPELHSFCRADVLKDLVLRKEKGEKFDIIILDPPSFSNSKRMEDDLDVDRDHPLLIRDCMQILEPSGTLYFSTNKRRFELHRIITDTYKVKEISQWTIPQDFHGSNIHRAFTINRRD